MTRRRLTRWGLLAGVAGPVLVLQGGCLLSDPDILFQAILMALNEIGVFALDNLVSAVR